MTEHNCKDGSHGNFRPARKIISIRSRFLLIADERMRAATPFSGIVELGALLAASNQFLYLFSEDPSFLDTVRAEAGKYSRYRIHLLVRENGAGEQYTLRHFAGGSETGDPVLYLPGRDILETWRNERLLDRFCDILEENTLKFIPLPVAGMLILRSIATVFPYDTYLGRHYLSQYIAARDALTEDDRSLLVDIKEKGLPRIDDTYSDAVRRFLKIERKLYTQFSH